MNYKKTRCSFLDNVFFVFCLTLRKGSRCLHEVHKKLINLQKGYLQLLWFVVSYCQIKGWGKLIYFIYIDNIRSLPK